MPGTGGRGPVKSVDVVVCLRKFCELCSVVIPFFLLDLGLKYRDIDGFLEKITKYT